jgi:Kef-type K+ transport system membrane component KefB
MNDQIKNFFSIAFLVLSIVSMSFGLWYLKDYGWDTSKYYFIAGGIMSLTSIGIEFTRAQNCDSDDF